MARDLGRDSQEASSADQVSLLSVSPFHSPRLLFPLSVDDVRHTQGSWRPLLSLLAYLVSLSLTVYLKQSPLFLCRSEGWVSISFVWLGNDLPIYIQKYSSL